MRHVRHSIGFDVQTRICLAGAAGHVGRELTRAILDTEDLTLVSAVGKRSAGQSLADLTGDARAAVKVHASVAEALKAAPADVLIDYTHPDAAKGNVRAAIAAGCHAVIGTSGLTDQDYCEIDAWAREKGVGVFAAGNFSITAALLQHFATLTARRMPHWEIIDYASDAKPDAPSGTARELAYQLAEVAKPVWAVPVAATQGMKEARGASLHPCAGLLLGGGGGVRRRRRAHRTPPRVHELRALRRGHARRRQQGERLQGPQARHGDAAGTLIQASFVGVNSA
jgi:4-hydroxy-tetrahydrodipicolinate reductase